MGAGKSSTPSLTGYVMHRQSGRKEDSSSLPPTRTKSKTGCKTCKIRRVRCGEERPACRRCVATGRVCDGYGIWGGGGNKYEQRARPRQPQSPEDPVTEQLKPALTYLRTFHVHPTSALTTDEKYHFEWFWRRTARKIPGAFYSDTANALFFQA